MKVAKASRAAAKTAIFNGIAIMLAHGMIVVFCKQRVLKMRSFVGSVLTILAILFSYGGNASECGGQLSSGSRIECIDVSKELAHVRAFYSSENGTLLAATQALIAVDPDGEWGPNTSTAFQRRLEAYIVIGGRGSDWGVNKPLDTERFIRWLALAKFATDTGGEFPD